MSNKYWIDKTNETDIVLAEDFNTAFGSISSDIDAKVDKVSGKGLSTNDYSTEEKGKLADLPTNADLTDTLGAKADKENINGGGKLGTDSFTYGGGAVGFQAVAMNGGAVGSGAVTGNGFAGGFSAMTFIPEFSAPIDAIQLGTGMNQDLYTLQVYDKKVLSYDTSATTTDDKWFLKDVGKLSALATTDKTTVIGAINELVTNAATSNPATLSVNTIYDLGVQTNLALNLPSGTIGNYIQVDFLSKSTPTTLTITSTIGLSECDLIPEANMIYSLYFDWGVLYYDEGTSSYVYGWRIAYAEYTANMGV